MTRNTEKRRKDRTPTQGAIKQYHKRGRYTISYSIAFSKVCEWAAERDGIKRPTREELDLAEVHALRMEDDYILRKIDLARAQWDRADSAITPMLPGPPEKKREATQTQGPEPYLIVEIDCPEPVVFSNGRYHAAARNVDAELDELIEEFDIK